MRMSKSIMIVLVLVLALGTMLVACGKTEPEKKDDQGQQQPPAQGKDPQKPAEEEIQKGGYVTFAMFSEPGGIFNPLYYKDAYEWNIIQYIYEGLFDMQDDLTYAGNIADSWTFSDDYKHLTVKMRQDVKWSDGTPLTAKDVYFTYASIADGKYNGNRSSFSDLLVGYEEYNSGTETTFRGVEVLGDYELVFHFREATPIALDTANFPIIPEHIFGKYAVDEIASIPETLDFTMLVGSGPFKPGSYVANESYEMVRNDLYFKGAPYLDGLVWRVVNADIAIGMLESGELHYYDAVTPADFAMVDAIPNIDVHEAPSFSYQYLGMMINNRPADQIAAEDYSKPDTWKVNPKFDNKKLRQAMAYAIDRQGIVDNIILGHGTVMNAPMPPVSWAAADATQINTYPFDPEKAKQLLDEAGYKDIDGDGFREDPQGNKWSASLDYPNGNPVRFASAPMISQWLKDVGLNVELNAPRDAGIHFDGLDFDESEMFLAGWSLDIDPDPTGIWRTTEPYNNSRWYSKESNQLIIDGISTKALTDQNFRKETYIKWQKLINDELPYIFLYTQNEMWAYNTTIQNVKPGPLGVTRDIHEWWIKK